MRKHVSAGEKLQGVTVSIFNNGRSRAVRIPKEFEFEGKSVIMTKQSDGSILMRSAETAGLLDYLKVAAAWDGEPFLEKDDDPVALDEIDFP